MDSRRSDHHPVLQATRAANLRLSSTVVILAVVFLFGGCASVEKLERARQFSRDAAAASKRGDWETARQLWAQAVETGDQARATPQQRAYAYYEYGRAAGVTCAVGLAERFLKKAYALDEETSGPRHRALVELARLFYDQKKYEQAVPYFDQALKALMNAKMQVTAPIDLANLLDEHATALVAIGRVSAPVQAYAAELRRDSPGKFSTMARIPYGTQCHSPEINGE